jgi:Fe-S cluster biogenesis protein NfuA
VTAPLDAREAGDRVERLLAQLRSGPDPRAAVVAEDLVRCLVTLYGAALERIVEISGERLRHEFCADPLVEGLMLVHDLHPLDADTRVLRALDRIQPHTGELRYDGIDALGVARVRLPGGGGACRSSLRRAIESAVREAAPEVNRVVVDAEATPLPLLQITPRPVQRAPSWNGAS